MLGRVCTRNDVNRLCAFVTRVVPDSGRSAGCQPCLNGSHGTSVNDTVRGTRAGIDGVRSRLIRWRGDGTQAVRAIERFTAFREVLACALLGLN